MHKIIARREKKKKLFQEERRARKEQEAKLRMAREKMELLALQRAPKRQDPLPQRKPLSQQEKVAIAEFVAKKEEEKRAQAIWEEQIVARKEEERRAQAIWEEQIVARKEEEKRAQALGEKHDKMMEKCYQDIVAHMQ